MRHQISISFLMMISYVRGSEENFQQVFHSWWKKMNEKKPISTSELAPNSLSDTYLLNYECSQNKQNMADFFRLENLKVKNNKIYGRGRISLNDISKKSQIDCLKMGNIFDQKIVSIKGTFKNGHPSGAIEITLINEVFVMANAHKGKIYGLVRAWTSYYNELIEVCSIMLNRCWKKTGADYFYIRSSSIENPSTLVLNSENMLMSGYLYEDLDRIEDFQFSKVVNFSQKNPDSMLEVTYELPSRSGIRYFIPKGISRDITNNPPVDSKAEEWQSTNFKKTVDREYQKLKSEILWDKGPDSRPIVKSALKVLRYLRVTDDLHFTAYFLANRDISKFKLYYPLKPPYNGRVVCSVHQENKVVVIKETFLIPGILTGIDGYFSDGILERFVILQLADKRKIYCKVKNGVLHGPFIVFGVMPVLPFDALTINHLQRLENKSEELELISTNEIGIIGHIYNGSLDVNPIWLKAIGRGIYYLEKKKHGIQTLAFIYPDVQNVLLGDFQGFVMKSALPGEVSRMRRRGIGFQLYFEKVKQNADHPIFFAPPTNETFGEGPQQKDFFERHRVVIKPSKFVNGGDGVFAFKSMKRLDLVCLYSRIKLRNDKECDYYHLGCDKNSTLSKEQKLNCNKYLISLATKQYLLLHPHQENLWHPTFGHKINSQFDKWGKNAFFSDFEHPRYGLIIGAFATKSISVGEEIYVDYGYKTYIPEYDWYFKNLKEYTEWLSNPKSPKREEL